MATTSTTTTAGGGAMRIVYELYAKHLLSAHLRRGTHELRLPPVLHAHNIGAPEEQLFLLSCDLRMARDDPQLRGLLHARLAAEASQREGTPG